MHTLPIRATRFVHLQLGVPAGTQGRSPRGVGFVASPGRRPVIRLSLSFIADSRDRSPRCLAVKARRAVSSPAAAGRTNPALLP